MVGDVSYRGVGLHEGVKVGTGDALQDPNHRASFLTEPDSVNAMTATPPVNAKVSRRQALRLLLYSAAGVAAFLTVERLASVVPRLDAEGQTAPSSPTNTSRPTASAVGDSGTLRVKAVYFQMTQSVNVNHEYFVLQSPALLLDLLSDVALRHPSVSPMIPTMEFLIDGIPARPSATLKDGDEVDFLPLFVGG